MTDVIAKEPPAAEFWAVFKKEISPAAEMAITSISPRFIQRIRAGHRSIILSLTKSNVDRGLILGNKS